MNEKVSAGSSRSESDNPLLTATPEQLFTGTEIGLPKLEAVCGTCTQTLHEGACCTVYAYQPAEKVRWYTRRCYCEDCAPAVIQTPTVGTSEVLVQAILGTIASQSRQTYRLCLTEVTLGTYSPPTEGREP